jgi:hypothetical protein
VQLNGSRKVIGVLRGYDVRTFPVDKFESCADQVVGLPKHCVGRCGRGERWWGESQIRDGG